MYAREDKRQSAQVSAFRSNFMDDLIFTGVVILFFLISAIYVRFCERV